MRNIIYILLVDDDLKSFLNVINDVKLHEWFQLNFY